MNLVRKGDHKENEERGERRGRCQHVAELVLSFWANKEENEKHRLCKLCIVIRQIASSQREETRRPLVRYDFLLNNIHYS